MVWSLILLTLVVLTMENLLDFRSFKRLERKQNRRRCLARLIRRHLLMAAFFSWALVLLQVLDRDTFLLILAGSGVLLASLTFLYERRFIRALGSIGLSLLAVISLALAALLFFEVMAPWLLVLLTVFAFILTVGLFDRFHSRFVERLAEVVPYFHRMDDAEFLAGLAFSERAYMLDIKALRSVKNAMIVGVFPPRRLYLSKAMLKGMRHDEIEAIIAHEVGHIMGGHILRRIIFAFIILAAFIGSGLLIFRLSHPATIAYTMLFSGWYLLAVFARSALALLMQRQEYAADRYAFEVHRGEPLISALKRLKRQEGERGHPTRALLHDTHPPIDIRMERMLGMLERQ